MVEIYYAPLKDAQRLTVQQVANLFANAGLPCTIEPEGENMFCLAFESLESNILASVEDGVFVFGTFNYGASTDPASIIEKVEEVMLSIGFSADEDTEYD